jgi:hypothetical protein
MPRNDGNTPKRKRPTKYANRKRQRRRRKKSKERLEG